MGKNELKSTGVPGKAYLDELQGELKRRKKKGYCDHSTKAGRWMVEFNEKLFFINPATQLQKDIWLDEATKEIGQKRSLMALRWFCFICNEVQTPPEELFDK